MPSAFARRHRVPELMDQPELDPSQHIRALQGLERINWLSGSAGVLWPTIRQAALSHGDRPLRVLDVACGGGDTLIRLWHKAKNAGVRLDLAGCDVSPVALEHARLRSQSAGATIRFFQRNILADSLLAPPLLDGKGSEGEAFDVVTCSLFLHHLSDAEAVQTLHNMARATRRLLLISDLRRSRFNWWIVRLATWLLTTSPIVRYDGPVSVAAAFNCAELRHMAQQAGLAGAIVQRRWHCRMLLTWWKPAEAA